MSATQEAIRQFMALTSSNQSTARRLLNDTGNDVEAAVELFFNSQEEAAAAEPGPSRANAPQGTGGFRSLRDYEEEEEYPESDPDEHNEYYAGGEKSGQVVIGGGGGPGRRPEQVEDVFDAARASGAQHGTHEDLRPGGGRAGLFRGQARTLAGGAGGPPPATGPPPAVNASVSFYRNGYFRVNDEEPRSMADPANAAFLQAIMRGQCPPELEPSDPRQQASEGIEAAAKAININLLRLDEDWDESAQPRQVKAFSGHGNRLGGDGTEATEKPVAEPAPAATPEGDSPASAEAWTGPNPDEPTTSLQIRLADGSRLVARFNLTQTVGDIRRFLAAARPGLAPGFRLATAFPSVALEDDAATLESAGLANAVVIQRA